MYKTKEPPSLTSGSFYSVLQALRGLTHVFIVTMLMRIRLIIRRWITAHPTQVCSCAGSKTACSQKLSVGGRLVGRMTAFPLSGWQGQYTRILTGSQDFFHFSSNLLQKFHNSVIFLTKTLHGSAKIIIFHLFSFIKIC